MKNIFNKIIILFAAALACISCEENAIPELTVPVDEGSSLAKFFFHAEDAPTANFYFNEDKVTAYNTSEEELDGHDYKGVYPSNAYALVPSGSTEVRAVDIEGNELAYVDFTFQPGLNYSVYLVGTEGNYEVAVLEDKLPEDDPQKIYWRFVNTMADMPFNVDAYAIRAAVPATEDTPAEEVQVITLGQNIGFKEGGEYQLLEPGSYTFKVFDTNSSYDPVDSTPYIQHSVNVGTRGRTYTTQIRGTYKDPSSSSNIDFWRDR